jgi:hypothetical protein
MKMRKNTDKIIHLMEIKNLALEMENIWGYFDEADAKIISGWSRSDSKLVWDRLQIGASMLVVSEYTVPDVFLCPYCLKYKYHISLPRDGICDRCEYGTRYGKCSDPTSLYENIRRQLSKKDYNSIAELLFQDRRAMRSIYDLIMEKRKIFCCV